MSKRLLEEYLEVLVEEKNLEIRKECLKQEIISKYGTGKKELFGMTLNVIPTTRTDFDQKKIDQIPELIGADNLEKFQMLFKPSWKPIKKEVAIDFFLGSKTKLARLLRDAFKSSSSHRVVLK